MCRIGGQGRGRLDTSRVSVGVGQEDRRTGEGIDLIQVWYLYV